MKIVFYSMFSKDYKNLTTQFILSLLYERNKKEKLTENYKYCGNINDYKNYFLIIKKTNFYDILKILEQNKIIKIEKSDIFLLNIKKDYGLKFYTNFSLNTKKLYINPNKKIKINIIDLLILSIIECYKNIKKFYLTRKHLQKILNNYFLIPKRTINERIKKLIEMEYISQEFIYLKDIKNDYYVDFYKKENVVEYKENDNDIIMKEINIKNKQFMYIKEYFKKNKLKLNDLQELEIKYYINYSNLDFEKQILREIKYLIRENVFNFNSLSYNLKKFLTEQSKERLKNYLREYEIILDLKII